MTSDLPVRMFFVPVQMGGNEMSGMAGRAALAAWRQGPDKSWAYHDLVFENQLELNEKKLTSLAKKGLISINGTKTAKTIRSRRCSSRGSRWALALVSKAPLCFDQWSTA